MFTFDVIYIVRTSHCAFVSRHMNITVRYFRNDITPGNELKQQPDLMRISCTVL